MNKKIKLSLGTVMSVVLSITFLSCSNSAGKGTINGNLKNFKEGYVYLDELTPASAEVRDSCKVDSKGNFTLKYNSKDPNFYRIRLTPEKYILIIAADNEKIEFSADADNLGKTVKITGSEDALLLQEATHVLQNTANQLDSLNQVYQKEQANTALDSIIQVLQGHYQKLLDEQTSYIKNFIDKHSSSLAGIAVIDKLESDTYFEYYKKLDAGLMKRLPNHAFTKMFHGRVEEMGRLAVGNLAPEINLNTPSGGSIALSSLRGKIVLIDFWASWCRPCRAENPNVVRIYNTYKDKGFDIYSVSLDKDKAAWQEAIQQDKLIWPSHVSDLGYWESAVVKQYNISGIPFTCLIDKEGKIVAKGLRGEALEEKIKELTEKK